VGDSVNTACSNPPFQLGKLTLDNLSANCFLEGSPVDDGLAGHIGIGAAPKVIFDYSERMILEPTD
jgi:hypothetical protein